MNNRELTHHGILGQKWGVRNGPPYPLAPGDHSASEKRYLNTKSGDKIYLQKNKLPLIGKIAAKISPAIKKAQDEYLSYTVRNESGKKVGNYSANFDENKEFNIVWADTKNKYRDRGYMTAILMEGERIAKELGAMKITAELVGNSPDIQHIVLNKMDGYIKVGEEMANHVRDTWGGLILVEKKLGNET